MKVLFLTNIPSPYMVDFFNEFGKLCNLTVIFERSDSSERDESWKKFRFLNFNGIILKGFNIGVDGAFCPQVIKYLFKDEYDFTIIANPLTPTGIISIFYLKLLKRKYIIESEGGFAKDGKGLKEAFKKLVIKDAFAYFSTTTIGDNYFIKYGADKNRIFKYPFSSIHLEDIKEFNYLKANKQIAKEKLNIKYDIVILSVGSIIPRKGHDITLKALQKVNNEKIGLYIVGGKINKELSELIRELKLNNIHFIDFVDRNKISDYYTIADIFILSTRYDTWGLVINEAMANGLPVITTNMCVAGTELIKNSENGYIFEVDDYHDLSNKVLNLITNNDLRDIISKNNLLKIKNYTINRMATVHFSLLRDLLEMDEVE